MLANPRGHIPSGQLQLMSDRATISERPAGLQMSVPAKAENVGVVRHALAGLAEELGMDEAGLADLKTVVTEACMNVVVHAYGGDPGPLSVEAEPDAQGLTVIVRDRGRGIRPQADLEQPSLRLGLSLIAALSTNFSISGGLDRGTAVSMRVPLHGGGADGSAGPVVVESPATDAETEIVVGRSDLLGPILARLVGALAARRELSIDRLSDAVLVTDAIAASAPAYFSDGRVRLGLDDREEGVELRLGPMDAGAAQRIREGLELPDVGGSLEALADNFAVEESDDGDYLVMRFAAVPL
jgi:serine/threonine-protein kinase RsbW